MATGQIVSLMSRRSGSVTVEASIIGSSTLVLDSIKDFHDEGGFFLLDGAAFGYTGRNIDLGTITTSAPLVAAVARGVEILIFPSAKEKWAVIRPDAALPEDAVVARVPHNLSSLLAADGQRATARQEKVEYVLSGNQYVISNVLSKLPEITEDAIPEGLITETMISPGSITTPLLAANSVATIHLQSGSVVTETMAARAIDGMVITGAIFRTAEPPNARVELTTDGLLQYDAVNTLITRIGGTQNYFSGSVDADDILVRDGLLLFGQNNAFGPNSIITLRTGQGGSNTPPGMSTLYKTSPIGIAFGFRSLMGYHVSGATEYGVGEFFGDSDLYGGGGNKYALNLIKITQDDSTLANRIVPRNYTRIQTASGHRVVMIGEVKNAGHDHTQYPNIVAMVYDDTVMNTGGTVAPVEKSSVNKFLNSFSWFKSYGLGRFIDSAEAAAKQSYVYACLDGPANLLELRVVRVTDDTTQADYHWISAFNFSPHRVHADEKVIGVNYGKASQLDLYVPGGSNPADQNVWVIHTTHQNIVLNNTGSSRLSNYEWPVLPGTGHRVQTHGDIATNAFSQFCHLTYSNNYDQPAQVIQRYSNWDWSGGTIPHYFSFAWRGHSSKIPEWITTPSPQSSITPIKRSWVSMTVPALPPPEAGVGGARDINKDVYGWVAYAGLNPANASMWRQTAMSPSGDPTTTSTFELDFSIATSGTNPFTATQNFPSLSPAKIVSSANVGGIPLLSLDGDGNIIAKDITTATAKATGKTILEDRVERKHIATPANPPAGFAADYYKSDNNLYRKTPAGIEQAVSADWTAFTPNMVNMPYTGGTSGANHLKIGRLVEVEFSVTVSGAVTGTVQMDLPFAASLINSSSNMMVGQAMATDTGTKSWPLWIYMVSTTRVGFFMHDGSALVGAASPHVWANTDYLAGTFSYRSAT